MSRRVEVDDIPGLAALLEEDWLRKTVEGPRRQGQHPFKSFWDQTDPGRDELLLALDRAVRLLRSGPLDAGAGGDQERRLRAKLRNARGYWSSVSEVVWGARLMALGRVTIEPLGRGPDFSVETDDCRFYVEVYAPDETRDSVHEDVEFPLTRWWDTLQGAGRGVRVGILANQVSRKPTIIHPLVTALKRAVARVRSEEAETSAIHLGAADYEVVEGTTQREAERDVQRGALVAFVSSPEYLGEGHLRVVTLTTGSWEGGTSKNPYKDLSQLVPGAPNVLVVDRSHDTLREWIDSALVHGHDGPFFNHPELAALVLSTWGVYTTADGCHLDERYLVVESGRSDAVRLPRPILDHLGTKNLF